MAAEQATEDLDEPPKVLKKQDTKHWYDGEDFQEYHTVEVRARSEDEAKRAAEAVMDEFGEDGESA